MRTPRPRLLPPAAFVALLVALAAPVARAHTVETIDGTVYEGRILLDNEEKVVIATTFEGHVTVPRDRIKAIDDMVPPLRDQLRFRADLAKDDVDKLWDLLRWAKKQGFEEELELVLLRIVELEPGNVRARKLLGHEKVDGEWMSPREKEAYLAVKHEREMRARGLVPYEGRWVTPEEKDALERGLVQDGDEWVTEEEYHRRRGERLVDGEWIRIGEAEAKARLETLTAARVRVRYAWYPHVDVFYDVEEEHAERVAEAAEKAWQAFRETLRPEAGDYPTDVRGRVHLYLFLKLPAYARFAAYFDDEQRCSDLVAGWGAAVRRQHSFWWVDPIDTVAVYKFPNTARTFVSNAIHNLGLVLLTRYGFNYRFPPQWLQEGFAYHLELESLGYSDTFSLSRGGSASGIGPDRPAWSDSDKWRAALQSLVAQGQDPPMKRIARMGHGQMHYIELVKSWSVVECLVRYDPEKFVAFVKAEKDRARTQEDALRDVYGWSWQELDRVWRQYVLRGFRHDAPPVPEGGGER